MKFQICKVMSSNVNLGFVDVGGWDMHANQGGAEGYLANRLAERGANCQGVRRLSRRVT